MLFPLVHPNVVRSFLGSASRSLKLLPLHLDAKAHGMERLSLAKLLAGKEG